MASTKKKKKKKSQKKEIASSAATKTNLATELNEMRNRLNELCRIHSELPDESREIKGHLEESMSQLSEDIVDLVSNSSSSSMPSVYSTSPSSSSTSKSDSAKESTKPDSPKESTKPVLTEGFYQKELEYLREVYNLQVDKCKKKDNFASKGWPVVRKAVQKVQQKIGETFQPLSKEDTHTFSEEEIDLTAEGYFQHVENIKDCLHAIAVSKDGNCFFDALSKGLNGSNVQQTAEIRLRGACYYANFFQTIHDEGFKVGWARATGK